MLSRDNLNEIKKTVRDFFEKTTFEVEIDFLPEVKEQRSFPASAEASAKEETLPISLRTEDPQILIGEQGQTLNEIQHLLKAILKRKIKENFYIDLDINNYKKKKSEYLKEIARTAADEVALTKKEKELFPMPAYERRVIHMELANRSDVITESVGEGLGRKVVVKPKI